MEGEVPIVHDVRRPISSLAKIAGTYHAGRGDQITPSPLAGVGGGEGYTGFCKAATLADIRKHDHVLTPGRYVGAEAADDGEPFEEKMKRLSAELTKQPAEGAKLDEAIRAKLVTLGFPIENEP